MAYGASDHDDDDPEVDESALAARVEARRQDAKRLLEAAQDPTVRAKVEGRPERPVRRP